MKYSNLLPVKQGDICSVQTGADNLSIAEPPLGHLLIKRETSTAAKDVLRGLFHLPYATKSRLAEKVLLGDLDHPMDRNSCNRAG